MTWQRLGLSLLVVVTYVLGLGLGVPALVAAPLQAGGLLVLAIVAVLAMLWIWREG